MDDDSYRYILEERRKWYEGVGRIYCTALATNVAFTPKGFHHLIFNGRGEKRNRGDVLRRLKVLHLSVDIIKGAKKISENRFSHSAEFWALKESGITVILRRIGDKEIIFYSIWKSR